MARYRWFCSAAPAASMLAAGAASAQTPSDGLEARIAEVKAQFQILRAEVQAARDQRAQGGQDIIRIDQRAAAPAPSGLSGWMTRLHLSPATVSKTRRPGAGPAQAIFDCRAPPCAG